MVLRNVWWRVVAVRLPRVRSRKRRSRWVMISPGVIPLARAAASSIANGIPSRRSQRRAMVWGSPGATVKAESTSAALSMNSRTAGVSSASSAVAPVPGRPRDGTVTVLSPGTARPSRLVASTLIPGAAATTLSTNAATGPSRCSQLSRTSSSLRSRKKSRRARCAAVPGRCWRPSADMIASSIASGDATGASSTSHAPSGKVGTTSAANCTAIRVFPTPPTPDSVRTRVSSNALAYSTSSRSRPTKLVACTGRFPG